MYEKFRTILCFIVLAIMVSCSPSGQKTQIEQGIHVISAGVPKPIAESKDYDAIFAGLNVNGISGFFPLFIYEEVPEPKTLDNYLDFMPPCNKNAPQFEAMRKHNIKLLIAGELFYPSDAPYPKIEDDPMKKLIECAGRENILGVYSYDEPFWRNLLEPSKRLYGRVKKIDATLPVFMVHAPMPAIVIEQDSNVRPTTKEEVDYYFKEVKKYNKYADVIGFDVYPIPQEIAQTTTPFADGLVPDYKVAISDYLAWLKSNGENKPYMIALQAFSYDDLGKQWLNKNTENTKKPAKSELDEMVKIAKDSGASFIVWFGPSYLKEKDLKFWQDVLNTSSRFSE